MGFYMILAPLFSFIPQTALAVAKNCFTTSNLILIIGFNGFGLLTWFVA
jgi:hypothetical protein